MVLPLNKYCMSWMINQRVSRGRVLSTISIGFILFGLGEGDFEEGIRISLIGLTLKNEDVFCYFAVAGFFWAFWKYWMVNEDPIGLFWRRFGERASGFYPAPASLTRMVLDKEPKLSVNQRYYAYIRKVRVFTIEVDLQAKSGVNNTVDFTHNIIVPFYVAIPWKLKHTVAVMLKDDEFSNDVVPYLLAFAAIVITMTNYIPAFILIGTVCYYLYTLFDVCLDHTGRSD